MTAKALIHIDHDQASMEGMLELPHAPFGVVLFAHGSGSSRLSPRNNYIVRVLHEADIGTLLLDLLTADEELDPGRVRPACAAERAWIFTRMSELCRELGTGTRVANEILVVQPALARPSE